MRLAAALLIASWTLCCASKTAIDPTVVYHPEPELDSYDLALNMREVYEGGEFEFDATLTNTGQETLRGCLTHPWEIRAVEPGRRGDGVINLRSHGSARSFEIGAGQRFSWSDTVGFKGLYQEGAFVVCFSVRGSSCRGPILHTACSKPIHPALMKGSNINEASNNTISLTACGWASPDSVDILAALGSLSEPSTKSAGCLRQVSEGPVSRQFKQVHPTRPIYSARIGLGYRALGTKTDDVIIWFWIGSHKEYEMLISRHEGV